MSNSASVPVRRLAARALVIDAEGRVLLVQGWDPSAPERGRWWHTPGGGVDEGEEPVAAARRELAEETGVLLAPDALRGPVHTHEFEFRFLGHHLLQRELFFLATVPDVGDHRLDAAGRTAIERDCLGESRWWSVAELRATSETVYPSALLEILDAAGRGGR